MPTGQSHPKTPACGQTPVKQTLTLHMAEMISQNPGQMTVISLAKDGEALYSQHKTISGADCGSDHQLLIVKIRLKLKKVRETTKPFNLNKIPYDYTVEMMNRFKGLDLVDRVPEELWKVVHNIV